MDGKIVWMEVKQAKTRAEQCLHLSGKVKALVVEESAVGHRVARFARVPINRAFAEPPWKLSAI
jgi:hypothetical protein